VEIAEILQSINSFNYREVQEFLNNNRALFQREETKRNNAACREHIAKHNIKVGDWFNLTEIRKEGNFDVTFMYELQVVKINRTCIQATGFQISPRPFKYEYPIDVPILKVIP
jgi:hypothetical protein